MLVGEHPLTRKKNKKKWGNNGALNFGGAMEQLARGYSSVVELSTTDKWSPVQTRISPAF